MKHLLVICLLCFSFFNQSIVFSQEVLPEDTAAHIHSAKKLTFEASVVNNPAFAINESNASNWISEAGFTNTINKDDIYYNQLFNTDYSLMVNMFKPLKNKHEGFNFGVGIAHREFLFVGSSNIVQQDLLNTFPSNTSTDTVRYYSNTKEITSYQINQTTARFKTGWQYYFMPQKSISLSFGTGVIGGLSVNNKITKTSHQSTYKEYFLNDEEISSEFDATDFNSYTKESKNLGFDYEVLGYFDMGLAWRPINNTAVFKHFGFEYHWKLVGGYISLFKNDQSIYRRGEFKVCYYL